MAVLNLTRVWLNRTDTGDAVSAQSSIGKGQQHSVDGDVSTWAGGRQRSMVVEGERSTLPITLHLLSLSTVATLRAWKGVPIQVRDTRGQRWFGTFFQVDVTERREADLYDVAFSLRTLSIVEGV